MSIHKWDVLEDMLVCSAVVDGSIEIPKIQKKLCKYIGITPTQLSARANNYIHLLTGRAAFWHTSRQERDVFNALKKHEAIIK